MPKKAMEILTESMFYVLMAFRRGPMCGIEVVDYIDRKTRGRIQIGPATLYTILGKYEKEKLIQETEVDGRKRTYRITAKGNQAYEEELERLRLCVADAEEGWEGGTADVRAE
ncbi:PadR family transcriptional regulator [Anaerolentibacter hominis]|uniref:PadR family transcriptional regulator n=1 Tax=Anaerolentibacter hominis TaxID=3079009 RepID=UPI0031B84923